MSEKLLEIKNFTFEKFISDLKNQMERVDALLEHIDEDPSQMTENQKIKTVLEVVYISIVNTRLKLFMDMTSRPSDDFLRFLVG